MMTDLGVAHPEVARPRRERELIEVLSSDRFRDVAGARAAIAVYLDGNDKWPTPKQLAALLKNARRDPYLEDHEKAVHATIEKYGHDYLAMGAVPWLSNCDICAWFPPGNGALSWWEAVGGRCSDPLVRHRHWWQFPGAAERGFLVMANGERVPTSTLLHALTYCERHAPDGTLLEDGHTYHPLRARLRPSEYRERSNGWWTKYKHEAMHRWALAWRAGARDGNATIAPAAAQTLAKIVLGDAELEALI